MNQFEEYEDIADIDRYDRCIQHWKRYAREYKQSYYIWRSIAIVLIAILFFISTVGAAFLITR